MLHYKKKFIFNVKKVVLNIHTYDYLGYYADKMLYYNKFQNNTVRE